MAAVELSNSNIDKFYATLSNPTDFSIVEATPAAEGLSSFGTEGMPGRAALGPSPAMFMAGTSEGNSAPKRTDAL
jgi:hypothetical protein